MHITCDEAIRIAILFEYISDISELTFEGIRRTYSLSSVSEGFYQISSLSQGHEALEMGVLTCPGGFSEHRAPSGLVESSTSRKLNMPSFSSSEVK